MLPSDEFCRAAVHPRFLRKEIFDAEMLVKFAAPQCGSRVRSLSLGSKWLCRSVEGVHDFGEKVASQGNVRKEMRHARPLNPDEMDRYLGYYSILRRHIGCVRLEHFRVVFRWQPENGDDRHFQIDLLPLLETTSKKALDQDERTARAQLVDALFGPVLAPNPTHDEQVNVLQKLFMEPQTCDLDDQCNRVA